MSDTSDQAPQNFAVLNLAEAAGIAGDRLQKACHAFALRGGWWTDLKTGENLTSKPGEPVKISIPEKLCLIHSEVSEALEGARKNLMDDHLPLRTSLEVELADAVIRCFDLAGGLGLDLGGAIAEKLFYNANRADHKPENRLKENGKQF